MPAATDLSRREILAALACLAGGPKLAFAAPRQRAGAPWHPGVLGERVWLDWRAEDLAEGPVAAWRDRAGGVVAGQSEAAKRPRKLASGEVAFDGRGQNLILPQQGRAYLAHRAVMILFRLDHTASKTPGGSLFYVNGLGGAQARQPAVGYAAGALEAHWRGPKSDYANAMPLRGDATDWHCLVSRRVDGRHHASLDGAPELVTGANICLDRNRSRAKGRIGDPRARSAPWAADCILVLQDELGEAQARKLMGWAMWRRGAQARLPADHPYRHVPPTVEGGDIAVPFAESSEADWAAIRAYWDQKDIARELEQRLGRPLDLRGYKMVFEDHFTRMSITDEVTGTGPWWSPVHGQATGKARQARIGEDPPVFVQSGSELTIRMQKDRRGWKSGVFTSVNLNGRGNTWKYGYFECRARASKGNGFSSWPAFWVKSVNEFFRLTESRLELDIYEGYNADPKGHHQAYHNWPAARRVEGRLRRHRYVGNYTGLTKQQWGHAVDLFDDRFHTYGMMVEEDWVSFYFDGRELSRFPTPIEAKQPLFILVDLALLPHQAKKAEGTYEFTLDYVRVYQRH